MCFFPKILKHSGLLPFSVFPRCQFVYTHNAGRTPALQQNWQSWEKSQNCKEKTQYLMNTLYMKGKITKFFRSLLLGLIIMFRIHNQFCPCRSLVSWELGQMQIPHTSLTKPHLFMYNIPIYSMVSHYRKFFSCFLTLIMFWILNLSCYKYVQGSKAPGPGGLMLCWKQEWKPIIQ